MTDLQEMKASSHPLIGWCHSFLIGTLVGLIPALLGQGWSDSFLIGASELPPFVNCSDAFFVFLKLLFYVSEDRHLDFVNPFPRNIPDGLFSKDIYPIELMLEGLGENPANADISFSVSSIFRSQTSLRVFRGASRGPLFQRIEQIQPTIRPWSQNRMSRYINRMAIV
jgi:hypothetical protein